ncbi:MAG: efflux transporter outer membrane subunit [Deltaproteobacteria bacterium]|nr:efflux transporter outer membrane subunit [Deltaproteobacteria bacterium]
MRRLWFYLIFMALCAGGCTLAPPYTRPAAPVPAQWPTGAAYEGAVSDASALPASEMAWRTFITDGRLQKVIDMTLDNNRDLRIASLNVERARAYYGIQRAELLPSVGAAGTWYKERIPADLSSSGKAVTVEQYSVDLGVASWEIDFFGRIRSLKDAALEEYLSTDQARHSARLLLITATAQAYLVLAADREALGLVSSTLEAQEAAYDLIKKRYDAGVASELDLRRAQSQRDAARGDIARYTQAVAQDENALDLLAGAPVPPELLPEALDGVAPPKALSPGLSSEALLRRPDILAAEHRLKAANANIGAARAAFFPRIALTTTVGTASADLSGLFKSGSGTWSFMPSISLPIFDARTWSAYRVTKIEKELSIAQYEKSIQTAFREVADALAARGAIDRRIEAQQSLVDALAEAYRLASLRYEKGIDSYLGVLDAQRSLYGARQGLVGLRLAKISNLVSLYSVLGGAAD